MGLKKRFLLKGYIFQKIRYKNVQYFNLAKLWTFLRWAVPNFFLALFFPFSRPFYSLYLLLFISFLTGNRTLINYSYNGRRFYHHFCTKNWSRFFNLLRRNAIDIQNGQLCPFIYPRFVICLSAILGYVKIVDITSFTKRITKYIRINAWLI